jgi:hypothetical protein
MEIGKVSDITTSSINQTPLVIRVFNTSGILVEINRITKTELELRPERSYIQNQ